MQLVFVSTNIGMFPAENELSDENKMTPYRWNKMFSVLKLCGFCGIVCGLLVDFRWLVTTWMRMWALDSEAHDDAAVVRLRYHQNSVGAK